MLQTFVADQSTVSVVTRFKQQMLSTIDHGEYVTTSCEVFSLLLCDIRSCFANGVSSRIELNFSRLLSANQKIDSNMLNPELARAT